MINIAIDGPAGAGKSTIAKKVAKQLGYIYVDTGALYRATALYMLNKGVDIENVSEVDKACEDLDIDLNYCDNIQSVILCGNDVTSLLRKEEVGNMASKVSAIKSVRGALLDIQRQIAAKNNVVMDGRDIGTTVLPDACPKIYLTASSSERAHRRYKELIEKGESANLDAIEKDIIERDNRDMNRSISPLKQASDAIYLDSSNMSIDEVCEAIIENVNRL